MKIDPRSELTLAQVETLKAQLMTARKQVLGRGHRPLSAGDPLEQGEVAGDAADMAEATFEQTLSGQLGDGDARLAHEIDDALARIDAGTYGVCEGSGEAIGFNRLKVQPWSRYSTAYQAQVEEARGTGHAPPTF
jgi:DnaK suppressor protein